MHVHNPRASREETRRTQGRKMSMTLESYLNGRWQPGEGVEASRRGTVPRLSTADHSVSPPIVDIPHDYNAAYDLVERNLAAGRGEKIAYHDFAGSYTYGDVAERVN